MGIGLLVTGFIIWTLVICLDFYTRQKGKITAASLVTVVASIFLVIGLYFIALGIKPGEGLQDFFIQNKDSLGDLGNTFLGIAITVFVLDTLNKRRQEEERKQEIFEEMESRVRDVAVEAVRLARKYGWLDEALKKVDLTDAQLAGVDLFGANLERVNLKQANLQEANLREANLQEAKLQWAKLQWADLREANLQGAKLQGADLQWANLGRANLQGAKLYWTNLQDVDLGGVKLQGANLEQAILQRAKLSFALYNKATTWPKGFDPKAAGAVLVD